MASSNPRYLSLTREQALEQFYKVLEEDPERAFPFLDRVATGEFEPCTWCSYCIAEPCRWDCELCSVWRHEARTALVADISTEGESCGQPERNLPPPIRSPSPSVDEDRCTTSRSIDYSWDQPDDPLDDEQTVFYACELEELTDNRILEDIWPPREPDPYDSEGESIHSDYWD